MTTARANADTGKLFIAQINKAEALLNEREWKSSAHTQTLNVLPLPGSGGRVGPAVPASPRQGPGISPSSVAGNGDVVQPARAPDEGLAVKDNPGFTQI